MYRKYEYTLDLTEFWSDLRSLILLTYTSIAVGAISLTNGSTLRWATNICIGERSSHTGSTCFFLFEHRCCNQSIHQIQHVQNIFKVWFSDTDDSSHTNPHMYVCTHTTKNWARTRWYLWLSQACFHTEMEMKTSWFLGVLPFWILVQRFALYAQAIGRLWSDTVLLLVTFMLILPH
jgi:hypothetical protein